MQAQTRGASPQLSGPGNGIVAKFEAMGPWFPEYGPVVTNLMPPGPQPNWVMKVENVQLEQPLQFEPLEEDHIEQMIEELLDSGSIEIAVWSA